MTQADAAVWPGAAAQWRQLSLVRSNDVLHDRVRPPRQQPKHSHHEAAGPPAGGGAGKKPRTDENKEPASRIRVPRALLEGRGDGAFIRLGDAMTATPEQHVHNFFAAHGKLGGAFLCANGAPCMVMDARMLRALDVQTKAMGQYIAQCGDDADPTRADTLVNMIAAEGLRVDLLAAVPGSALLEDTHGSRGLPSSTSTCTTTRPLAASRSPSAAPPSRLRWPTSATPRPMRWRPRRGPRAMRTAARSSTA